MPADMGRDAAHGAVANGHHFPFCTRAHMPAHILPQTSSPRLSKSLHTGPILTPAKQTSKADKQSCLKAAGAPTSGWGKAGDSNSRAWAAAMGAQEVMSSPACRASRASLQSTHCSTRVRAAGSPTRLQRKRHTSARSSPVKLLQAARLLSMRVTCRCALELACQTRHQQAGRRQSENSLGRPGLDGRRKNTMHRPMTCQLDSAMAGMHAGPSWLSQVAGFSLA